MQSESRDKPRALLITGTVGAGKTSVAISVGSVLAKQQIPHAVIDLDAVCKSWPSPPGDPFNLAVTLQILKSVAGNCLSAGAHRLLVSGVVETKAERERYREAFAIDLQVCRLRADLAELHRRLRTRHASAPAQMRWHIDRAGQLDQILDGSRVDDFEIASDGRTVSEVAVAALSRACWL